MLLILLLFGNYYAEANVQELLPDSGTYLPPLGHKLNNSYLLTAKDHRYEKPTLKGLEKITKSDSSYVHSKPKVIDDPLPAKVDCVKPLDIDLKSYKHKGSSILTGLVFNVYEKPLFREGAKHESAAGHFVTRLEKNEANNKTRTRPTVYAHNITAESSIESQIYVKNPTEVNVFPISFYTSPATKFKWFNYDQDIELSGSAPEVIYQPGDDIAFLKDTSAIDDYEHTFSEKDYNEAEKSTNFKASTKPPLKKESDEKKKKFPTSAAYSGKFYPKTPVDTHQNAATTQHLVTHYAESENKHSGQGYIYDKPKIPFTF